MNISEHAQSVNALTQELVPQPTKACREFYKRVVSLSAEHGFACAGLAKWQTMIGVGIRTFRSYLSQLKAAGWILYEYNENKLYTLVPQRVIPLSELAPPPPHSFTAEILAVGREVAQRLAQILSSKNGKLAPALYTTDLEKKRQQTKTVRPCPRRKNENVVVVSSQAKDQEQQSQSERIPESVAEVTESVSQNKRTGQDTGQVERPSEQVAGQVTGQVTSQAQPDPATIALLRTVQGVTESTAQGWARQYDAQRIRGAVAYYRQQAARAKVPIANPGGYLRGCLERGDKPDMSVEAPQKPIQGRNRVTIELQPHERQQQVKPASGDLARLIGRSTIGRLGTV